MDGQVEMGRRRFHVFHRPLIERVTGIGSLYPSHTDGRTGGRCGQYQHNTNDTIRTVVGPNS